MRNGCLPCGRRLGGLGVVDPITIKIGLAIGNYVLMNRMTAGAAARKAAEEFEEFLTLTEKPLMDLSVMLARETDVSYWEWFNTLRAAQRFGIGQNGAPTDANGQPIPPTKAAASWGWMIGIGLAAVALIVVIGGDRF